MIARRHAARDEQRALIAETAANANAALRVAQDGQEALARSLFHEMAELRAELREWKERCRVAEEMVQQLQYDIAGLRCAVRLVGTDFATGQSVT